MMHQMREQREDEGERKKRTAPTSAVVVRDFKISSPLRLSWRWCSASNFALTGLISRLQPSRCGRFLAKISCSKRCGGGVPRAMMMWFGGMGRCQCTCEKSQTSANQATKTLAGIPSRRLSTLPICSSSAVVMPQKPHIRRKQRFKRAERSHSQRKSSQPDASQNSQPSSILRLNPTVQRTCPPALQVRLGYST
jgi:hypothetical protein